MAPYIWRQLGSQEETVLEEAALRLRREKPDNCLAFTLSLPNLFNLVLIDAPFQSSVKCP